MDKRVVVTGGSGALGGGVVERYLRDGWRVRVPWIVESEVDRLQDRVGSAEQLELIEADVTRADAWERVLDGSPVQAGVLLVGGFDMAPVAETEPEAWDRLVTLNATSVFQSARALLPRIAGNTDGGSLVTVAAEPALERSAPGMGAYAATKAAVVSLTGTLAREGSEKGVNVNGIAPRIIDTPANRKSMPDADRSTWLSPAEIAEVIAFLTSPEGRIVNGSILTLNRG